MEFEFDPTKDEANRFKHGLKLAFGMRVFQSDDHVVVARTARSMVRTGSRPSDLLTESSIPSSTFGGATKCG